MEGGKSRDASRQPEFNPRRVGAVLEESGGQLLGQGHLVLLLKMMSFSWGNSLRENKKEVRFFSLGPMQRQVMGEESSGAGNPRRVGMSNLQPMGHMS